MILRVWHGWTTSENADAYEELLTTSIVPGIISRTIPGLAGVDILRRTDPHDADVEFVTLMSFDDWSAVETFAGPERRSSIVPPAAREVLKRFDAHSQHYELVSHHTAG